MLKFGPTSIITLGHHVCTRYAGSSHRTKLTAKPPPTPGVVVTWDELQDVLPQLQFYAAQSGYDEPHEHIVVMFCVDDDFYRFTCDVRHFTIYDGMTTTTQAELHMDAKRLALFFRTRYSADEGVQFALSTSDALEQAGIPVSSQYL